MSQIYHCESFTHVSAVMMYPYTSLKYHPDNCNSSQLAHTIVDTSNLYRLKLAAAEIFDIIDQFLSHSVNYFRVVSPIVMGK